VIIETPSASSCEDTKTVVNSPEKSVDKEANRVLSDGGYAPRMTREEIGERFVFSPQVHLRIERAVADGIKLGLALTETKLYKSLEGIIHFFEQEQYEEDGWDRIKELLAEGREALLDPF